MEKNGFQIIHKKVRKELWILWHLEMMQEKELLIVKKN